jgi:hypothetical protein
MEIKITSQQSVFDAAVQSAGTAETAFEIALQNGVSLTDDLIVGKSLGFAPTDDKQVNKRVQNNYKLNNIKPATGLTAEDQQATLGGIGYMGISIDFIVS